MPALGSKVVNFDQQYRQVMGKDDPFQILLPESQAILKQHGIDPSHPQMGGGGRTVKMIAPNGQTKDVPADQVEHYKALGAKVAQ